MAKNPPPNAGGAGSIPDQGTKFPHAHHSTTETVRQKQIPCAMKDPESPAKTWCSKEEKKMFESTLLAVWPEDGTSE